MEAFGAYASDSDEEQEEEPQDARPLLALQDSDSDEEAAEAAVSAEVEAGAGVVASSVAAAASKTGAEAAKPAKRKLPSALDALKSGGSKPSFLQAADTAECAVLELQERKLEATKPDEPPPLAPPLKKAHTTPHQISAPPGASTAGRGGSLAGKPEKKKVDVKDKVKGQRLKGQTLGGETTRWKSDEEMRLRQQFD